VMIFSASSTASANGWVSGVGGADKRASGLEHVLD
jgi:hypothetical protein